MVKRVVFDGQRRRDRVYRTWTGVSRLADSAIAHGTISWWLKREKKEFLRPPDARSMSSTPTLRHRDVEYARLAMHASTRSGCSRSCPEAGTSERGTSIATCHSSHAIVECGRVAYRIDVSFPSSIIWPTECRSCNRHRSTVVMRTSPACGRPLLSGVGTGISDDGIELFPRA